MYIFLFSFFSKIVELEEELRVVGNNMKSLEVSEEKVRILHFSNKNNLLVLYLNYVLVAGEFCL